MDDIDSAGVYFLSVEEFESRLPARIRGAADAREAEGNGCTAAPQAAADPGNADDPGAAPWRKPASVRSDE
jgi:hypothetical protein